VPLTAPKIDSRSYDDLLRETIARIPVHNPEWTNFNRSDPGITLVELFAFLTENLLYRANQIPDRNRRKFLSLLGVPLQPAEPARAIVTFSNERGPLAPVTLGPDLELRAGQIPFRTQHGLDVLPIEAKVYFKRSVPLGSLAELYDEVYVAILRSAGDEPQVAAPYETVPLDGVSATEVDLRDTADGSLWIALLARQGDDPAQTRAQLANRTLNIGLVPVVSAADVALGAMGAVGIGTEAHLTFSLPDVPPGGLPLEPTRRVARYAERDSPATSNVVLEPGIVQMSLPGTEGLGLWDDLEPIEAGVAELPPAFEDTKMAARVVTWVRVRAEGAKEARFSWAGVNATMAVQRATVPAEVLPQGTGQPDQEVHLAHPPVLPGSVQVTVTAAKARSSSAGRSDEWVEIDDLLAAGPEVPVADPVVAPGVMGAPSGPRDVFSLDAEAGVLRFGDGIHGRRPPANAVLRARYDYSVGRQGNLGPGAIKGGPALPDGFSATNPVRTWGGTDAETVADGEKQISRYIQHRDRLVTAEDFETIARRTPGVEIGRVEVLPTYNPELAPSSPGNAPGAVTLLLVPQFDPQQPDAPRPDRFFLDAVCRYLNPRRLVTTELFLRGPSYVDVWLSIGMEVIPGESTPDVRDRVKQQIVRVLSPLPLDVQPDSREGSSSAPLAQTLAYPHADTGWPLRTDVSTSELTAFVARVPGVRAVNAIRLGKGTSTEMTSIPLRDLELPRVVRLSVVQGDPVELDQLQGAPPVSSTAPVTVPVPALKEVC
jgi:hypothetical protein